MNTEKEDVESALARFEVIMREVLAVKESKIDYLKSRIRQLEAQIDEMESRNERSH